MNTSKTKVLDSFKKQKILDSHRKYNFRDHHKSLISEKKAENILTENVIFIILNLAFFAILLVFIFINTSSVALIEQKTAKQIALLIDASNPGTEISLGVEEILKEAGKNNIKWPITLDNENNLVIVKLTEKGYYEYAFFNDVDVSDYGFDFSRKILRINIK